MTYGAFTQDFVSYELVRRPRKPIPQAALCALALTLSTSVGLWALYARPFASTTEVMSQTVVPQTVVASVKQTAPTAPAPSPKIAVPLRRAQGGVQPKSTDAHVDPTLLYPSLTSGNTAGVFAMSAPLSEGFASHPPATMPITTPVVEAAAPPAVSAEPEAALPRAADVPLPLRRPTSLLAAHDKAPLPARTIVQAKAEPVRPAAPAAQPSFFDKMFGETRPSGNALAYAAPEDTGLGGLFGGGTRATGGYDRYTAVYDITAHTVTLPDGTRLEAHSGLGPYKDNPASVAMRMVGVTPPNLYQLTFREASFHGVRALRLTPLGGTTYGRAGLLAHTYMLRGRPPGESNGCVVFADYQRFLRAFESGQIRRLKVVVRL